MAPRSEAAARHLHFRLFRRQPALMGFPDLPVEAEEAAERLVLPPTSAGSDRSHEMRGSDWKALATDRRGIRDWETVRHRMDFRWKRYSGTCRRPVPWTTAAGPRRNRPTRSRRVDRCCASTDPATTIRAFAGRVRTRRHCGTHTGTPTWDWTVTRGRGEELWTSKYSVVETLEGQRVPTKLSRSKYPPVCYRTLRLSNPLDHPPHHL